MDIKTDIKYLICQPDVSIDVCRKNGVSALFKHFNDKRTQLGLKKPLDIFNSLSIM